MIDDQLVLDREKQCARCTRCGAEEQLPEFPMALTTFEQWALRMMEKHRTCVGPMHDAEFEEITKTDGKTN